MYDDVSQITRTFDDSAMKKKYLNLEPRLLLRTIRLPAPVCTSSLGIHSLSKVNILTGGLQTSYLNHDFHQCRSFFHGYEGPTGIASMVPAAKQ